MANLSERQAEEMPESNRLSQECQNFLTRIKNEGVVKFTTPSFADL